MGGEPVWAVVALELREGIDAAFVEAMYDGVMEAAREYGFAVVGGNVVGGVTRLGVAVTMGGEVEAGRAWRRAGARVGDGVFVTGAVGGAALGFRALRVGFRGGESDAWAARYRRPVARLREARALVAAGCVTACIDLSDGLAQDLGHLARASGVGIEIRAEAIPVAAGYGEGAARFFDNTWHAALWGGDDYELAFTSSVLPPVGARIGDVVAGAGVRVVDARGSEIGVPAGGGFDHGGAAG
jgi:thiamine-monophosphate kinase